MTRNRGTAIATAAATVVGAIAGAVVFGPVAIAENKSPPPTEAGATATPTLDAKAALLTAIAFGYTKIRRAGLVGDFYQVEALDSAGNTVRLVMDPESGAVLKIEKDRTEGGM